MSKCDLSLKHANNLLRSGCYEEAKIVFKKLIELNPNFKVYKQGYNFACKKIAQKGINSFNHNSFQIEVIHPSSLNITTSKHRLFFIVTPVLNGEKYLSFTIDSILNQEGSFFIDYLVKDAQSSDNTLKILESYAQRISGGKYRIKCSGLRFRVISNKDEGLYDGLKIAFAQQPWRDNPQDTIQTYLNADDIMLSNSFKTVVNVFNSTPARWICGQINIINEKGQTICSPEFPFAFAREDILEGLHDGRVLYTIQQEGCFWLQELYIAVGGINCNLKMAGDFDLWRRFAIQTELLALDKPLASFRSHSNQLSKQINRYYEEIDQLVSLGINRSHQYNDNLFSYTGEKALPKALYQKYGPVGFIDSNGKLKEIAYIKRCWLTW